MYQKLKHLYLLLCISVIPILLTACGKSEEEKALARAARAKTFGVIGIIVNVIICIPILMNTIKMANTAQRGTNAVTRFVRKGVAHTSQSRYYGMLTLLIVADVLFLFFPTQFHIIKLGAFVPPIGCIVLLIVLMTKSKNDKERVKDARVVTKGTLEATSAVGETVGEAVAVGAAAYATGGDPQAMQAAAAAGKALGKGVGNIAGEAGKNMEVEGYRSMDLTETKEAAQQLSGQMQAALTKSDIQITQIADTELFKQKAMRLGCNETMSLGDMARVVLKYAPESSMKELPEGLSDEEKAVALLGAYKQQPKAIVDASYREVQG